MTQHPPSTVQALSGYQLATAFDSRPAPLRTSAFYRLAVLFVFLASILLPVVYAGIIVSTTAGVWWYATHATVLLTAVHGGRAMILVLAIYLGPLIAGGMLVLVMILPLFWRSGKTARPYWIDRREQPLLYAYIDHLCDAMGAPRPARIDLLATPGASAHIDNGLLGLFSRRLVLTIGLPLAQSLDLKQFTGILAHELGHFTQGASMRLSAVSHRINGWFFSLAWRRNNVDQMIESLVGVEEYWGMVVVGWFCQFVFWIARLVFKAMALLSHALTMHLSRQAEFDADRQAARIVGGDVFGDALQTVHFLHVAGTQALNQAQAGWTLRRLPDDLVELTDAQCRRMPAELKEKIVVELLSRRVSWFDTHPPVFKRIAAMKKRRDPGILKLDAPAACLFKEFDELCKLVTIRLYASILGEALQPEHLVPAPQARAALAKSVGANQGARR